MIIDSVTGYQPPAPASSRISDSEPKPDDKSPTSDVTSKQFAALLALLAGNGHRLRADLLKKPSADDVALLDRLLNGTLVSGEVDSSANGGESAQAMEGTTNAAAAVDAVRYSMINDIANSSPADGSVKSKTSVAAQAVIEATRKGKANDATLAGLARALGSGKQDPTLTRAVKRSSSVEELMARGDTRAANTRVMIDALLNSAGTPEGEAIANSSASLTAAGTSAAELVAFVSSLAAARNASAADPNTPITDTSALMPELRAKLDRVISRMQTEWGHDVQVVETARSPERQAQLYAQGRTTPGQVVTWTLDSAHIRGAAADVVVDGSWNNPQGFSRLQQIAREEGLRTLGAKDPGHLELFNTTDEQNVAVNTVVRNASAANTSASNGEASGVARVANVAGVAGVAQVAVAESTSRARTSDQAMNAQDRNAANVSLGALADTASRGAAGDSLGDMKRDDQKNSARESVRERSRDSKYTSARDGAFPAYGDAQNASHTNNFSANASERTAPAAGANSAQRVADANALREDAPAKAVSQMTLDVEGPGGTQRITVDMRGNAVSTHIATDASSADRLRSHVGELQGALEQHGLQSEAVRITAPATRTTDAAEQVKQASTQGERDAMRLAGANGSNANDGTSQQGLRDRSGAARDWEKHNDARNARDEQQRQENGQRNRRGPNYEEL